MASTPCLDASGFPSTPIAAHHPHGPSAEATGRGGSCGRQWDTQAAHPHSRSAAGTPRLYGATVSGSPEGTAADSRTRDPCQECHWPVAEIPPPRLVRRSRLCGACVLTRRARAGQWGERGGAGAEQGRGCRKSPSMLARGLVDGCPAHGGGRLPVPTFGWWPPALVVFPQRLPPRYTHGAYSRGGGDTRPPHGGVDPPGTGRSRKRRRATAAPNPAPSARPASKAWPASRSLPNRFHQSPRPGQHAVPASPVGRARHHTASQGAGTAGGGGVRGESGRSPREVQRCLLVVPAACLTAAAPEWSEREDGTRRRLGRARRQLLDECTFHCA